MEYNDIPRMKWSKRKCEIKEGKIIEIKGTEPEWYNPFDYHNKGGKRSLYLEFISINENVLDDIIKFINNFGFLGFEQTAEKLHQKELKRVKNIEEKMVQHMLALCEEGSELTSWIQAEGINNLKHLVGQHQKLSSEELASQVREAFKVTEKPYEEDLQEFKKAILDMRVIVEYMVALANNDLPSIIKVMHPGYLAAINNLKFETEPTETIVHFAKIDIERVVNYYIRGVSPLLERTQVGFMGSWVTPNLLTAMYVMIYTDLIDKKVLRKCANETCKDYFYVYGNDVRKIYCNESCSRSQAQREYRRRKKKEG